MNILAIQYSLKHHSLDIYLAGCAGPHCTSCHNPGSWDFNQGTLWDDAYQDALGAKIDGAGPLIKRIFILGGEPLDQNHKELESLLIFCHFFQKEVWLFTGKSDILDVPFDVRVLCDYIKLGPYLPEDKVEDYQVHGITLASGNQVVLKRGEDY
jgi:organic radical activating enzyme